MSNTATPPIRRATMPRPGAKNTRARASGTSESEKEIASLRNSKWNTDHSANANMTTIVTYSQAPAGRMGSADRASVDTTPIVAINMATRSRRSLNSGFGRARRVGTGTSSSTLISANSLLLVDRHGCCGVQAGIGAVERLLKNQDQVALDQVALDQVALDQVALDHVALDHVALDHVGAMMGASVTGPATVDRGHVCSATGTAA